MSTELNQILIDSKEPKNVITLSHDFFDDIKVVEMLVGDLGYPDNSVCIERKTVLDLIGSVRGRLWLQLENMVQNYEHPYLIIVGRFDEVEVMKHTQFTRKQFLGACASIGARYNIPVYNVDTNRDYFTLSRALMLKSDGERKSLSTVHRLAVSDEDVITAMVSCVPGIGEKRSKAIVDMFNVEGAGDLCGLSVDDLVKCDGVGIKRAEMVKRWF